MTFEELRRDGVKKSCASVLLAVPTPNLRAMHDTMEVLSQDLAFAQDRGDGEEIDLAARLQGWMHGFCCMHLPADDEKATVYDWPLLLEATADAVEERDAGLA